ncbi:unnamed protein product, partial [Brachionus calyciflorus]
MLIALLFVPEEMITNTLESVLR